MGKIETAGFKRFWPMRQHCGRDAEGRTIYRECFMDVTLPEGHPNQIQAGGYDPDSGQEIGWNGSPVGEPGNNIHSSSENYRRNYDLIHWDTPKEKNYEAQI